MRIYILGCGAIGSNIAMNLVFDRREDDLVLVDFDKIEARNYQFGTQYFLPDQEGMNKIDALKFNIYKIARKIEGVDILNYRVESKAMLTFLMNPKGNLLIDCLDNYSGREYVRKVAKRFKIDCLHVGFSPQMTFEACWNESYETPNDLKSDFDICEAEGARAFIQYVSGIATAVIIEYIKTKKKIDIIGNRFTSRKVE